MYVRKRTECAEDHAFARAFAPALAFALCVGDRTEKTGEAKHRVKVNCAQARQARCQHIIRTSGEYGMKRLWIASSAGLPREGQKIDFQLDDRDVSLTGFYDHQTFRSRWSGYEVYRVKTWRSAEVDIQPAAEGCPDLAGAGGMMSATPANGCT